MFWLCRVLFMAFFFLVALVWRQAEAGFLVFFFFIIYCCLISFLWLIWYVFLCPFSWFVSGLLLVSFMAVVYSFIDHGLFMRLFIITYIHGEDFLNSNGCPGQVSLHAP